MSFTADIIDAREAERIGLINRVVPAADLETETYALARRIADGPPRVLAAAKALLDRAPGLDLESALHWEALTQGAMIASRRPSRGSPRVLREAAAPVHRRVERSAPSSRRESDSESLTAFEGG